MKPNRPPLSHDNDFTVYIQQYLIETELGSKNKEQSKKKNTVPSIRLKILHVIQSSPSSPLYDKQTVAGVKKQFLVKLFTRINFGKVKRRVNFSGRSL